MEDCTLHAALMHDTSLPQTWPVSDGPGRFDVERRLQKCQPDADSSSSPPPPPCSQKCSPFFGCGVRSTSTTSSCPLPSTAPGPRGTPTSTTAPGKRHKTRRNAAASSRGSLRLATPPTVRLSYCFWSQWAIWLRGTVAGRSSWPGPRLLVY
jgi:hypothetical protein